MSKIPSVDAGELTEDAYTKYAEHVNGYRALPDARDGLKIVQRRILATLAGSSGAKAGSLIASSSVVGDCNKLYHPHGDIPIYGAIVTLVNDRKPLVKGHGNFGYKGLLELPEAAQRYTKVGLTDIAINSFLPLLKFSPMKLNENEFMEPIYIPTAVPYCLMNSAYGIGVGCATHIPAITKKSIYKIVKALLLESGNLPRAIPRCSGEGVMEIENKEIDRLNKEGACTTLVRADVSHEKDEQSGRDCFVINNVPKDIDLSRLTSVFADAIRDKLVSIRDESSDKLRVVVYRNKGIKRIKDKEIEKRIWRVCQKQVSYQCYVSHEGKAKIIPPAEMIRIALDHAIKAYKLQLADQALKLEKEIIFQKVKRELAIMLTKGISKEKIMRGLKLTNELYAEFVAKPISTLRSKPKETKEMKNELKTIRNKEKKPRLSYGKDFGWL